MWRELQRGIWLGPGITATGCHKLWERDGFVKKYEGAGEQGLWELQAQLLPLQHQYVTWCGLSPSNS